jgi:hypothetical protein
MAVVSEHECCHKCGQSGYAGLAAIVDEAQQLCACTARLLQV